MPFKEIFHFICWNYWERFIIFPYSFDMYKNWSYNLTSLSNTANLYLVSIIDWRCFQNSCVKLYPSVVLGWGLWKVIGFRGGLEGWASCGRVSAFKKKEEAPELSLLLMWGHSERQGSHLQAKRTLLPESNHDSIWSRTSSLKNCEIPGMWHFVMAAQEDHFSFFFYVLFLGFLSVLLIGWDNQFILCLSLLVVNFILNSALIINFSTTFFSVRFHFID